MQTNGQTGRWWLTSSLLVPAAAVAILLGAVYTGKRPATDDRGRPIVVYAHPPCPPDLMKHFNEAFDAFRASHPDIDLRVLHVTGNYEDKIKVMFAGNVAPDVIFMYPHALPAWVDLDALAPLNDLLESNGKTGAEDYFPAAVRTFSYRGNIYGLPKDASATILFYNPGLFAAAGIEPPGPDWTWDDMLRACKALTGDTDGDGRPDTWGITQPDWWVLVAQNGGRILDDEGRKCLLGSPEALEALEFWVALRQTHGVVPTPEHTMDMSIWRLFALRRVAMLTSMYPAVPILRRSCDFDWDIALLPAGPVNRDTTFTGSALAVTSPCRNREAAFEWVRWMTAEGMTHVMTFDIPAFEKLGRSQDWRDASAPPPSKQVAVDVMDHARPPMQHPSYSEIMDAITPHLDRANRGETDIRDAVARLVPEVDEILEREYRERHPDAEEAP